jgi:hypothetical protein
MAESETPTIACTLNSNDFEARLAAIAELARNSLRSYHRQDLVLHLSYAAEFAERVREMVRNEQSCCAFLTFDMIEKPEEIDLTITAPEDAREAADALFDQFIGKGELQAR